MEQLHSKILNSTGSQEMQSFTVWLNMAVYLWLTEREEQRFCILEGRRSQDLEMVCEFLEPEVPQKQGDENKLSFSHVLF